MNICTLCFCGGKSNENIDTLLFENSSLELCIFIKAALENIIVIENKNPIHKSKVSYSFSSFDK